MPTRTAPPGRHRPTRAADQFAFSPAALAAAGAAYALCELAAGLLIGNFFAWSRAEAVLFLAFRPWLLLPAVLLAARLPLPDRAAVYASGLTLAAASQTLLLLALGAPSPWPEALRGLLAGAILAGFLDLLVQLGRRFLGRWGRAVAAGAALALFTLPGGLRPYERIVLPPSSPASGLKPNLLLLSSLPLVWGEKGPLDPGSRPAAAFNALEQEFRIQPIDAVDDASLRAARLLLVAQPRALAPTELAALDAWVRSGGRMLVLTDPALAWHSDLPLGDIRRPPPIGMLAPLLEHWGLILYGSPAEALEARIGSAERTERRLLLLRPGRLQATARACQTFQSGLFARCRLGKGRAIVLADADLMHDSLWAGTGASGASRHLRLSDNPLVVADLLDELASIRRPRVAGGVAWARQGADRRLAVILALIPIILAATPGLVGRIRRRL